MSPKIASWTLEISDGPWTIRVRPMDGKQAPYEVRVFGDKGDDELMRKIGVSLIGRALEDAGSFIAASKGKVDHRRLAKIGESMDRKRR